MAKPKEVFRAGALQASVFLNVRKVKGKDVEIPSVSLQKRYLENGEWKSTNSLNVNDLPKAIMVLFETYDYLLSSTEEEDDEVKEEGPSPSV